MSMMRGGRSLWIAFGEPSSSAVAGDRSSHHAIRWTGSDRTSRNADEEWNA